MGEGQEEDFGSGAVVRRVMMVENYKRQGWDCSFENDKHFDLRLS